MLPTKVMYAVGAGLQVHGWFAVLTALMANRVPYRKRTAPKLRSAWMPCACCLMKVAWPLHSSSSGQ